MFELKIISTYNKGKVSGEYILLEVLRDTNLHNYILFDSTYNEFHSSSGEENHSFWFPYTEVREGDYIYLYTGAGENRKSYDTALDYTEHLFFWGLKDSLWNKGAATAYIFRVNLPPQIAAIVSDEEKFIQKLA